jgi:hypothetical protein
MADINTELQTIATAVYGSEMRGAIHDAIEKVNEYGTGHSNSWHSVFGDSSSPFVGEVTIATYGSLAIIADCTIVPQVGVPYVRPSGTIVDDTGITLFRLPDGIQPIDVCDYKFYLTPNASDAYQGNQAYIKIANTDPVVKLYYGWNDVLTTDWPEYHVTGMYFCG